MVNLLPPRLMKERAMRSILVIGLVFAALGASFAADQAKDDAADGKVTLLGRLAEWQYPGSGFGGATMSDGGNRRVQSVNCQALLTTDDSVETVAKYYSEKFVSGPDDVHRDDQEVVAQSVSTQDDSEGRGVELRVIVVHRAGTSTTLVISRAKGEAKTHIAWSHYVRF
jgi:hypothetical protein